MQLSKIERDKKVHDEKICVCSQCNREKQPASVAQRIKAVILELGDTGSSLSMVGKGAKCTCGEEFVIRLSFSSVHFFPFTLYLFFPFVFFSLIFSALHSRPLKSIIYVKFKANLRAMVSSAPTFECFYDP